MKYLIAMLSSALLFAGAKRRGSQCVGVEAKAAERIWTAIALPVGCTGRCRLSKCDGPPLLKAG